MKKIFSIIIIITISIVIYKLCMLKNSVNNLNKNEENKYVQDEIIICRIIEKENLNLIIEQYKGYKVSAKLEIPKINLESYVIQEYSYDALKVSLTKFWGSDPNKIGNFCIAGHNYKEFKNINKLEIGDILILTDNYNGSNKYKIYNKYEVLPSETDCLSQKTKGEKEITLITCTQSSKKRIIIKAKEIV